LDGLRVEDKYLEPVFYTLRLNSNKFRSATAILAALLCNGQTKDVLPIAAASELLHSAIIVHDDIADDDKLRRGSESAWFKYGINFALHSAVYSIPTCIDILRKLNLTQDKIELIVSSFLMIYQEVCRTQMGQANMRLRPNIPYPEFLDIHYGKTALGRWSISTAASLFDPQSVNLFEQFAFKLGDAGSLKNDIEDFVSDDGFEPFCTDIRNGDLTYPLYYYYSMCGEKEKKEFAEVFGKSKEICFADLRQNIIDKGTLTHCVDMITKLVEQAKSQLKGFSSSREKDLLISWAENHIFEL